jgi:L-glutamine-phosphate cytidylyltransferase
MRMFILAAGTGSRLYPLTKNTPKSLLDLGQGGTLLESQIEAAIVSGEVDEVCIITGYKSGQIEERIRHYDAQIKLRTVFNPFFDVTNNLVSLWCAHLLMTEGDFIITNGDNLYRSDVLRTHVIVNRQPGIYLTVSRKADGVYDEDDMKVIVDADGNIVRVSKEIAADKANAESVGLVMVRGERLRQIFAGKIVQLLKHKDYLNRFWLEIFNALAHDGVFTKTLEIPQDCWSEVDFHPDIALLRAELAHHTLTPPPAKKPG